MIRVLEQARNLPDWTYGKIWYFEFEVRPMRGRAYSLRYRNWGCDVESWSSRRYWHGSIGYHEITTRTLDQVSSMFAAWGHPGQIRFGIGCWASTSNKSSWEPNLSASSIATSGFIFLYCQQELGVGCRRIICSSVDQTPLPENFLKQDGLTKGKPCMALIDILGLDDHERTCPRRLDCFVRARRRIVLRYVQVASNEQIRNVHEFRKPRRQCIHGYQHIIFDAENAVMPM